MERSTINLDALIERAAELNALPVVVFEAQQLMADPRTSAQSLAKLLNQDPAISSRLLKLANSSFYGFNRQIGNLSQAVVVLGFQAIKNVTLTIGTMDSFKPGQDCRYDFPAFWAHSVATAIASERIARITNLPEVDQSYMAGLLHDVGKLVAVQHVQDAYARVGARIEQGESTLAAECLEYGVDHACLGARLLGKWHLPDALVDAVATHHTAGSNLAGTVQLADHLVSQLGLAAPDGSALPDVTPGLSEQLAYDADTLATWLEAISQDLQRASEFFELVGHSPFVPEN